MKTAKKAISIFLCVLMLASSVINDGWSSIISPFKASALADEEQNYNDARVDLKFNKDWHFSRYEGNDAYLKGFDDSSWNKVDLPHDFSINQEFTTENTEAESGNLPGGTGWYRKWFNLYEYYSGDRIFLNFDGAYQHTYVYVNGKYVGENHYGYNSFSFEISEYLITSNSSLNLIAVKVVNDLPSSRWYPGSGIYRDVSLTIAGPVHVSLYGPQITTPNIADGDGTAETTVTLHNDTKISKKITVEASIIDMSGNVVGNSDSSPLTIIPGETEISVVLSPSVTSPKLWSLDNPYLYKLRTVIKSESGELLDEYKTTFGYRFIEWNADKGFALNGEFMKLKGVCLHHDQGALGAIQEYDAVYRQISILKEMGCNAIRTSHNTASRILIEICNKLGMLVVEEFFDGWDVSKNNNTNDFSKYFFENINSTNTAIGASGQKWFEFVVEQTILRDRHDPCVIAWDIGNELGNVDDIYATGNYEEISTAIVNLCKELDSDRAVLHGNNSPINDNDTYKVELLKDIDNKMDVIGGNYVPWNWQEVMNDSNDPRSSKPFVATESASALSNRGVYYTMGEDKDNKQITAYDTHHVGWGNNAAEAWYYVAINDWFSGEFIWTGFDYIGEPTPWDGMVYPSPGISPNSSYFGFIDTAGFAKDSFYLYRSLWNDNSTTLHLVPGSWNKESLYLENGFTNVAIYSNAHRIELLLNGNIIATAASKVNTTEAGYTYRTWEESVIDYSACNIDEFYTEFGRDFYSQFKVKYSAGNLSVKAYDKNGIEITDTKGTDKVVGGTATKIAVNTWNNLKTFTADGADFIYVEFEAQDENGNFINDYNGTVNVKVDDTSDRYAKIVGVDNGNPATTEKFQQPSVLEKDGASAKIQMYNGKALVILKTTEEEGTIKLTAVANDGTNEISTQGVTVTSVKETGTQLTDELEEVIKQNGNKYEVTLYDEYEIVKHHINNLEPPVGGSNDSGQSGNSGNSGTDVPVTPDVDETTAEIDRYEVFIPTDGYIPDGKYVIYNKDFVLTGEQNSWSLIAQKIQNPTTPSDSETPYDYSDFDTDKNNIFEFIHQGNNIYHIRNANGNYFSIRHQGGSVSNEPQKYKIQVNQDGYVYIVALNDSYLVHYNESYDVDYFCGHIPDDSFTNESNAFKMWLYKPVYKINTDNPTDQPSNPDGGDADLTNDTFYIYHPNSSEIPDGEYIIYNKGSVLADTQINQWTFSADTNIQQPVISNDKNMYYDSFSASQKNIYKIMSIGNNRYHIINTFSGIYFTVSNGKDLMISKNDDGSVLIYTDYAYAVHYGNETYYTAVNPSGDYTTEHADFHMWLYTPKATSASSEKRGLYDILFEGIEVDYSKYSRDSFEVLLRALEEGVAVYKNPDSTDADFAAATQNIRNAIDSLVIDIKKIDGTLFKYGYDNSSGTPDYKDGGILMNQISVQKMKNAILTDENILNQIKQLIGYSDSGWNENEADNVLEAVAEAYAKIYTLQFTGRPTNDSSISNSVSNTSDMAYNTLPMTMWNLWTKNNTHGANDDVLWNEPVHDGASVQGLASSTLENGIIVSHSAYPDQLTYANDGPTSGYSVDYFTYSFNKGSEYKTVRLEYLNGISVYFPDLFSKENIDANGNATSATSGKFAKYYWDADFPIFINTDEYGVNTYHYDSKDINYLVQSEFNDTEQTVDIDLNHVEKWSIYGPNVPEGVTATGFFPFNYKKGVTSFSGEQAIYHYGFTFEHNFYIPQGGKHVNGEDVIFNFSGDDDVYVYIDGVLVLDNGGLHGAREVTINFTDCTVNYQYAMDVTSGKLKGDEYEVTYSYNDYFENPNSCGYNADTIAAINKLHEVISDGQVHTLNFFYLERGSSASNCKISFNLSETSEEVRIIDQDLTLDYGLPVEYNIQDNNDLSQAALDNGVQVEYLGICAINDEVESTYTFELPEILVPFEPGITYKVDGMKYGDCTIDKEGNVKYSLKSMNMTESEHFYVCAKITGDPTYANDITYYQLERTTFIPATTIYYEDTYETITYNDGKVPSNYDNTVNMYGIWQESGNQPTTLKQSADLTDSEANPYGYETNYLSFAQFSGGSIHYVDVSTKNNPNKKYSGGDGGAWPTVEFSFTGTGFDLISITDNTTGAFSVKVTNTETKSIVKNTVVDTFYGYNYGQIFADADGKPTLDSSLTPMYRAENGTFTSSKRYYDVNGDITDVPHYYDENRNVVENNNGGNYDYAYAYAFGWIVAEQGSTETLYQIPVIKITDLDYASYDVTITPTFTSAFKHSSVNSDGTNYYRVYFDAIKIYSPAGTGDDITDKPVRDAYATDDELYPDYLEIKNMLIGAESLSETEEQGIIFIDGIAALDNDLEKYRNAGPNNELYLAKGQAVAFEIWATSVPTDIQLGAKLACGNPQLTISYAKDTTTLDIRTAHDTFYSLNTVLPNSSKLTWHLVTGADGNKYYTTGTVVIQNTGSEDSVLSVTNLKWTFSQNGGKGYFRIPTPVENETVSVASSVETPMRAYTLMRMRTADLDVTQSEEPEIITSEDGSSIITIKLNTSSDVDSIIITDVDGNEITPEAVKKLAVDLDGRGVTEWLVTLKEAEPGTHIYTVTGAYENGYTDHSKAITVTVTVETPPVEETTESDNNGDNSEEETPDSDSIGTLFDSIIGFFNRILEFFRALLALFGVSF